MAGAERSLILGNYEFNPYAAGAKTYGMISSSPTIGPVDKTGYMDRDRRRKARKQAVLAAMKAKNAGAFANPNALRMTK
jgi:hypothetical protein